MSLIELFADDDQDDDEAIVKRPHARRVTTWQGINQSHIFNLPLSIAAAKNSRQIPRGNREARAMWSQKLCSVHVSYKPGQNYWIADVWGF